MYVLLDELAELIENDRADSVGFLLEELTHSNFYVIRFIVPFNVAILFLFLVPQMFNI